MITPLRYDKSGYCRFTSVLGRDDACPDTQMPVRSLSKLPTSRYYLFILNSNPFMTTAKPNNNSIALHKTHAQAIQQAVK